MNQKFKKGVNKVPQGHDSSSKRDKSDGVEAREMGKKEVNRSKDHDEVSGLDGLAVMASQVMDLLQRVATSNHVHNVHTNFHH